MIESSTAACIARFFFLNDGGRNQSRKLKKAPAFLRLFVHLR
jgi:hypothetical protein